MFLIEKKKAFFSNKNESRFSVVFKYGYNENPKCYLIWEK